MNVADAMKGIYGNELYTAAYIMDQAEAARIEAAYQEAWDSGNGFTAGTMFCRRQDEAAELEICCKQMRASLEDLVTRGWLSRYNREEICSLCNLLAKGPGRQYTRVCLVADLAMDAMDIAREWSKLHPDDRPVLPPDPDIG